VSWACIYYQDSLTLAGIFVTRCVNVVTLAAKGARVTSSGPDLSKMNPALQMKNGMNGNGAMAPPKSFGRDRTLGKTVTIRKGPYKGMLGIVKDATDTTARVELHSKSKVVNIDKDSLAIKEYAPPHLI
jgi:transcription elongation factor SPT5